MWFVFWLACTSEIVSIPGTTARIDAVGQVDQKQSELELKIMSTH